MLKFMILNLIIYMSLIIINLNHPMSLGLILLIQTILISLSMGIFSQSFWFSYILFLIFIGGMLILFIYMTSIASNELFYFSMKKFFLMNFMFSLIIFMIYLNFNYFMNYFFYKNSESMNLTMSMNFICENSLNLIKMYNFPTYIITLMLINYLLLTLIIIVKITNFNKGPMRINF